MQEKSNLKVEQYFRHIKNLLNINNTLNNANGNLSDNLNDKFSDKKNKNNGNNKQISLEAGESKFSISSIINKTECFDTYKKGFFSVSEEIKDEEEESSLKHKRDTLMSKLMIDKSIIIDSKLMETFEDKISTSLFLSMSSESRQNLFGNPETDFNLFHSLIGFNTEEAYASPITNELVLNLCNNFIRIDDSKILFKYLKYAQLTENQ